MASGGFTTRIPLWVRVSVIVVLVLAAVLVAAVILLDTGVGGHGSSSGGSDHESPLPEITAPSDGGGASHPPEHDVQPSGTHH